MAFHLSLNPSPAALSQRRVRARKNGEYVPLRKPGPKIGSRFKINHGTPREYMLGCRCDDCRRAAREHGRKMRTLNPEKARLYVHKSQHRARQFLRDQKDKPCTDCGVKYPFYVMQFDHLRDKKFSLSSLSASYGRQRVLEEIEKCEVVCANCHAERTYSRIKKSFEPQLN